ncbi:MAG: tyrosine-type recombinase/integrase [Clostridiales bacterium]|nr:tyrosine-type recombinase/integrase [Clostridiales bacterium]
MYTVDRAFQDFMIHNERKNLSPESMRYYRENITRFITWLSENRIHKSHKITDKTADDYMLFLLRTVPNRTSVNTYMRAVRRFLNYLSEQRIIKPIKVAPLKDSYKIKATFDLNETEMILNSVQPNDDTSVIMLLLLSCGMRSRSVRELRVGDVHVNDRYIDICHTKSGEPLCLPISRDVAIVLQQYIAIYGRHGLLFVNSRGEMFNRDSLAKRMNKRLRALGIPQNKTGVHIFRHTFGKIMSMNACPTAILQRWFGHSDIRMTQRYIDLYGTELKNTMSMLPTSSFQYA